MYEGKKIILRAYEKNDIERAHELYNNLELMQQLEGGAVLSLSTQDEEKFLDSSGKDRPNSFNFAVEDKASKKLIGGCGYFKYSAKNRNVWIGISIADSEFQGKGYGTDTMTVLIDYLFNELNLIKVTLGVLGHNQRAQKFYEKFGFIEEGRLKNQHYRNGEYHDEIIMSYFRD